MEEEVAKYLVACVMSKKNGIRINNLDDDYTDLIGEPIPVEKLGFKSLLDLVHHLPGLKVDPAGTVTACATENTHHLQELIQKQKDPTVKNKKKYVKNDKRYGMRYQPYVPPNQYWENNNCYPSHEQPYSYPQSTESKYKTRKQSYNQDYQNQYMPQQQYYTSEYQPGQHFYQNRYPPRREYHRHEPYYTQHGYRYQQSFHAKYESERTVYHGNEKQYEDSRRRPYNKNIRDLRDLIRSRKPDNNNSEWQQNYNTSAKLNLEIKANFFECFANDTVLSPQRGHFYNGYQLIADNNMHDLTQASPTALCAPALSAKKATLAIRQNGCSTKTLIALGTVDVLKGLCGGELILDMKQLVRTVQNVGAHVALCTLPPLPGIAGHRDAIHAVNQFNHWVMTGDHGARAVNLSAPFKDGPYIKHDLFEKNATTVPGCKFPIYSWNKQGCEAAERVLNRSLVD